MAVDRATGSGRMGCQLNPGAIIRKRPPRTEVLTHVNQVNGWEPAVYMSNMLQNFCLFHESNLSLLNFRIVLLM